MYDLVGFVYQGNVEVGNILLLMTSNEYMKQLQLCYQSVCGTVGLRGSSTLYKVGSAVSASRVYLIVRGGQAREIREGFCQFRKGCLSSPPCLPVWFL